MKDYTAKKRPEPSGENSPIKNPRLSSLPKFVNNTKTTGPSNPLKEFYRRKRILRISKIRSEKTDAQLWATESKKKAGTRPEVWAYLLGLLVVPNLLISTFSPIIKHLPMPIGYVINGILVLIAIEILDWLMLKKYQSLADQESNGDLVGLSAVDLIQIEDELFHEVETNTNRKTAWVAGRLVVFALGAIGWLLSLVVLERLGIFKMLAGNPLSILVYIGSLGVGIFLGDAIWKAVSVWARFSVRTLLHYWPLAIYVGFGIVTLWKQVFPH